MVLGSDDVPFQTGVFFSFQPFIFRDVFSMIRFIWVEGSTVLNVPEGPTSYCDPKHPRVCSFTDIHIVIIVISLILLLKQIQTELIILSITCSVLMLHINHTKKQCCNSPIIDEPKKTNGTCTTFQVWFWSTASVAHVDHKDSHVSRFDEDPPHTHRMFSAMNNVEEAPAERLSFNGDICLYETTWSQIWPKVDSIRHLDSLILFRKQSMFCALYPLFRITIFFTRTQRRAWKSTQAISHLASGQGLRSRWWPASFPCRSTVDGKSCANW